MVCRDKVREKARQGKLEEYRETGVWPRAKGAAAPQKKNEAWSEKKAQKAKKKERKRVKLESKEKRKRNAVDDEDWDELARDARELKKFKKKKVCFAQTRPEYFANFLERKQKTVEGQSVKQDTYANFFSKIVHCRSNFLLWRVTKLINEQI